MEILTNSNPEVLHLYFDNGEVLSDKGDVYNGKVMFKNSYEEYDKAKEV